MLIGNYYLSLAMTTILLSMGLHIEYNLYFHDLAKIKKILTYIIDNNSGRNFGPPYKFVYPK
jgi:hypothetical protein